MAGGKGSGKGPDGFDQAMEGFDQAQSIEEQARPRKERHQLVTDEEKGRITRVFQRHLGSEGATARSLLEYLLVLLALAGVALALTFWYVFFDDSNSTSDANVTTPAAGSNSGGSSANSGTQDFSGTYSFVPGDIRRTGPFYDCFPAPTTLEVRQDGESLTLSMGLLSGGGHLNGDEFSGALSASGVPGQVTLHGRFFKHPDGRTIAGHAQDFAGESTCDFDFTGVG